MSGNGSGPDEAAAEAPVFETLELELSPPVTVRGVTYDVLRLQEPRAQQVRSAEQKLDSTLSEASVTEYQMELVRQVAKVTDDVVKALTVRQLYGAYNFLADFITDPYAGMEGDAEPQAIEMPLSASLSFSGGQVTSLSLREPTAEELRRARNLMRTATTPYTHRSYEMSLLESVTGLPAEVIHGLRIRDLTRASRHLAGFIEAGRKTGKR